MPACGGVELVSQVVGRPDVVVIEERNHLARVALWLLSGLGDAAR
jgi:hypothetical protein